MAYQRVRAVSTYYCTHVSSCYYIRMQEEATAALVNEFAPFREAFMLNVQAVQGMMQELQVGLPLCMCAAELYLL